MKKKVALPLLLMVILGVTASHISFKTTDDTPLMVIDGREVDVYGQLMNQWVVSTRQCQGVSLLTQDSRHYRQVAHLIQAYSPPQSRSARIAGMWSMDEWTLAEVEFDDLLPAVVTVKNINGEPAILPGPLWSGYTRPWMAAPFIRHYLRTHMPDIPASLLNCFEPRSPSFNGALSMATPR